MLYLCAQIPFMEMMVVMMTNFLFKEVYKIQKWGEHCIKQ